MTKTEWNREKNTTATAKKKLTMSHTKPYENVLVLSFFFVYLIRFHENVHIYMIIEIIPCIAIFLFIQIFYDMMMITYHAL